MCVFCRPSVLPLRSPDASRLSLLGSASMNDAHNSFHASSDDEDYYDGALTVAGDGDVSSPADDDMYMSCHPAPIAVCLEIC